MQNLQNYSIYELRALARKMGVKAPTTKTQTILIEQINQIQNNKLKPFFTKKGRPSKDLKLIKENICVQEGNVSTILSEKQVENIANLISQIKDCLEKILIILK